MDKRRVLQELDREIRGCRRKRKQLGTSWTKPEEASWEVHQNEGYLSGLQLARELVSRIG